MRMPRVLLSVVTVSIATTTFAQNPKAGSNSEKYRPLEIENALTAKYRSAAMDKTNKEFAKSSNFRAVERLVRTLNDRPRTLRKEILAGGQTLELKDQGLGKPVDLILTRADGFQKAIFKSTSLPPDITCTNFSLSPDGSYVAVTFFKDGSIDRFFHMILKVADLTFLKGRISSQLQPLVWTSSTNFVVNFASSEVDAVEEYSVTNLEKPTQIFKATNVTGVDSSGVLVPTSGNPQADTVYVIKANQPLTAVQDKTFKSVVSIDKNQVTYIAKGKNELGEIRRYLIPTNPTDAGVTKIIYPEQNEVLSAVQKVKGTSEFPDMFGVRTYWGAKQKMTLISEDGKPAAILEVPDFANLRSVSWKVPGKILNVTLTSAAMDSFTATYDVAARRFTGTTPEDRMMSVGGKKIVSYLVEVTSNDGTKIPTRLTHLKNMTPGKHPAYFTIYGGFSSPSSIFVSYVPMELDFILRGGIVIGAAVRGGNEFGEPWHKAAMFENKVKTLEDVSSVAKELIRQNITEASKIALSGASNGGFVTAAAGLMFPEAFGLIIPMNGVDDMLAKERLDKDFVRGWTYEYGDSDKLEHLKYLRVNSPVEQASKGIFPNFLIINGRNDSRVHPAHSLKLYAALTDNNRQPDRYVRYASINQSGHFSYSMSYQDLIGWRSQVLIWTAIYDQAGIQIPNP